MCSSDLRLAGNPAAPRENINSSVEQRMDYSVGRIDFRLTARVASIEGRRNALIFFRMYRTFGDF